MKIEIQREGRSSILLVSGKLDVDSAAQFLETAGEALGNKDADALRVDVGGLRYIDSAGAAVLIEGYRRAKELGRAYTLRNLTEEARRIFALTDSGALLEPPASVARPEPGAVEWLGGTALGMYDGARGLARLIQHTLGILARAPFRRRLIRWDLALLYMERTGWEAIPIICMIAVLVGIVLALQAAIQLERYGALIFVADLVAVSLTRELGPLITAVVVAGRSGSSFTAEIGTMKVNEEIDALRTMGLDTVEYLVVPKFAALLVTLPCLAVLTNTVGIFGGFLIGVTNLGIAPKVYFDQTIAALQVKDIVTGLIKAFVFAGLIAATGCQCGFQVEGGADGVGRKTTLSVVVSIILVIVADAVFTSIFYAWE